MAVAGCRDDSDGGGSSAATLVTGSSATPITPPSTSAATAPSATSVVVPEGYTVVTIVITDADGNEHEVCVWLADAAIERSSGLMGVTDLGGGAGMLFQYESPSTSNFWMMGTPMPLSIAFFDGEGNLVSAADMEPCLDTPPEDCRRYPASGPYTHALEVPQGGLSGLGVDAGSTLRVLTDEERERCPGV
jgi:uncharacterized membrane protein (UPF0127 family)